ncbi:HAD-IB family hydrolase [Helicobacter canis]|uniref:HAD hydrolase, family IB n=1 Tax=Helicobacter canis NCTC 12740 TaxID=1357399 RepID=V8CKI1_9HELI|nr:HAD-IB family hydrolase [Helicobacter canis]ETD27893.1 HAD hydrolase, family IB [Helicobacter canis NCTC 12740]
MKQILAIFDFCESIVSIQSISPYLELARKANSAYRSPNSYKQRLLRKAARLIYNANPRILEEEKEASHSSLRMSEASAAIHKSAKADSSAKMDCHALPSGKTRNDRNLSDLAQDSRIFNKNAQNVFSQNATRRQDFGDKNGALLKKHRLRRAVSLVLQGESRELPKAVMTAGSPQKSPFLAQKPMPEIKKLNLLHKALTLPTYPELAGLPLSTALSLAQSYALSLRAYSNQKVLDKLLWHKAQGHTIVVVSGGLGIYIRPFMQEFGIDTILAVELESTFDKQGREILSGNRAGLHTMQERKLYALDNHLDLAQYDLPNSYAYSDCPSDVPLLSLVGKPCVIQGSQETRWAGILGYPILVP